MIVAAARVAHQTNTPGRIIVALLAVAVVWWVARQARRAARKLRG